MSDKEEKTIGQVVAERRGKGADPVQNTSTVPYEDNSRKQILQSLTANIRNDYVEVDLPSRGKFYDKPVLIRPFSFEEERMMMTASKANGKDLINNLMARCVQGVDIRELVLPDKIYLLFKLREISYGNEYKVSIQCTECSEPNDLIIEIDKLGVDLMPAEESITAILQLPGADQEVEVGLLRVKDENILTDTRKVLDNLYLFINRVADVTDKDIIRAFVRKLPAKDISILKNAILNKTWGLDSSVHFVCNHCEGTNLSDLPLNADFFSVNSGD